MKGNNMIAANTMTEPTEPTEPQTDVTAFLRQHVAALRESIDGNAELVNYMEAQRAAGLEAVPLASLIGVYRALDLATECYIAQFETFIESMST